MATLFCLSALLLPHAAAVLLRGTPAPVSYFWSGKNGDVRRTGTSAFVAPSVLEGGPAWSFKAPYESVVTSTPLIDQNKNIYLTTRTGIIFKMSPNGETIWTYSDPDPKKQPGGEVTRREVLGGQTLNCIPALMDGKMFVADLMGRAIALDMETGKEIWKANLDGAPPMDSWSVAAADGTVLLYAGGKVQAFDAADGVKKWAFQPDSGLYNALLSVTDGTVGFADQTGSAYRVNLSNGKLIWKFESEAPHSFTTGGAVLGDGVMYVTSNTVPILATLGSPFSKHPGRVKAINFTNGELLWDQSMDHIVMNAAVVGRVDPGGNGPLSLVVGIGANPQPPILDDGVLGITKINYVISLDAKTGKRRWTFELPPYKGAAAGDKLPFHMCLPDNFSNAAIGGDGIVYIGNQNGNVYAIQDKNGDGIIDPNSKDVSSFDVHAGFQGSPAIAPGMLVVTPCDGMHVFKAA